MRIDPKVEELTRTMLGHVIRDEFRDLASMIRSIEEERRFQDCITLCVMIAGYVAVDVNGNEWPSEASIQQIAEVVCRSAINVPFDQEDVRKYLTNTVLGSRSLAESFSDLEDAATQPIFVAAALLLAFFRKGGDVWSYLDEIEEALEASADLKPSITPAVILRDHLSKA